MSLECPMDSKQRQRIEVETLYGLLGELSYYKLLLVETDCRPEAFETAFRKESRSRHPDRLSRFPSPFPLPSRFPSPSPAR